MRRFMLSALVLLGMAVAPTANALDVRATASTGAPANHPTSNDFRGSPYTYWILGGGARANWTGNGSLLTKMFPYAHFSSRMGGWAAAAKDHEVADIADVTSFAITIDDPQNLYEVIVMQDTSDILAHPVASATLPDGYVLTGGGCNVRWEKYPGAAGNMLTGSFPSTNYGTSWVCTAKDHNLSSPAIVTAYAIGIRPRASTTFMPTMAICETTSQPAAHPVATATNCTGNSRARMTGGGARAVVPNNGGGQLLTGSYPASVGEPQKNDVYLNPTRWIARSKDHNVSSPGTVTAYAIMVDFGP